MPSDLVYCPRCHRETPRKCDVNGNIRCRFCGNVWYQGRGLQAGRGLVVADQAGEGGQPSGADPVLTTRSLRRTPPAPPPPGGELPPRTGRTLRSPPVAADNARAARGQTPPAPETRRGAQPPKDLGLLDALVELDSPKPPPPPPPAPPAPPAGAQPPATGRSTRESERHLQAALAETQESDYRGDPLIGYELRGCRIERRLGGGGMGTVYLARQLSLDRLVALKVLSPELRHNQEFIRGLEGEAKILARINHPNILHVYDFGDDAKTGAYFMIMEYVDGSDLTSLLRRRGRLPVPEALHLIRQAALGLDHAAAQGVIHRDIKPDNLMITRANVVKVSDFGLATHLRGKARTEGGVRVGTPAFMSPEQCQGSPVDIRSDIYGLGCTAFVAIAGQLPYEAESPYELMLRHRTWPVPDLREVAPGVSAQVASLLQRMMAKRPAERFATMLDLVAAIEAVEGLPPLRATTPPPASRAAPSGPALPDWMDE